MSEKRILIGVAIGVAVVGGFLAIILPISFATLDYYEVNFGFICFILLVDYTYS